MEVTFTHEPSPLDYYPLDDDKNAFRTTVYFNGEKVGFLDSIDYQGVLYKMFLMIEPSFRGDKWIPHFVHVFNQIFDYDKIVWVNIPENVNNFIQQYVAVARPAHRYFIHGGEDTYGGYSYSPPRQ